MDRTVLLFCGVIFAVGLCLDVVSCSQKYDTSVDNKYDDESKIPTVWFSPRLGKRKRSSVGKVYEAPEQELAEILDDYDNPQYALITLSGNDKLICKNLKGKRSTFIPRLGRNVDTELSGSNKWLQDGDNMNEYMVQRSPPFAPRLGKRLSPFAPRLGRDI